MGYAYINLQRFKEALDYLAKAKKIYQQIGMEYEYEILESTIKKIELFI
ncbi:MAG: hypothetical protein ACTSRA_19000 [Promethearchaeota archaeon]